MPDSSGWGRSLAAPLALRSIGPTADDLQRFEPPTPCAAARPGSAQRAGLREELARLETEVARLAAAIAAGGNLPALVAALQERELRRQHVRTELEALERVSDGYVRIDERRILSELRKRLSDWQKMLRQETPHARQVLRALLAGRLVFTPQGLDGGRFYSFEGPATLNKLFAGLVIPKKMVTPEGSDSAGCEPFSYILEGLALGADHAASAPQVLRADPIAAT